MFINQINLIGVILKRKFIFFIDLFYIDFLCIIYCKFVRFFFEKINLFF